MGDALFIFMRWLHIASVATLIGGLIHARLVLTPALGSLAPDSAKALGSRAATRFRPYVLASVIGLIISGVHNIVVNPGHSTKYHIALGIKLLLALHVFAVAFLVTEPENPRRARMMTGAVMSGLIIIGIAAYLRRIY